MKASNIVKKLEKEFGVKIALETTSFYKNYSIQIGRSVVEFDCKLDDADEYVSNIYIRRENDHSDMHTDYFAGNFWHTIKSAVSWIQRQNEWDKQNTKVS